MKSDANSKRKDLSESLLNAIGGYITGYIIGIMILPYSVNWIQKDPLIANLVITLSYASVNFGRSYILRRFFAQKGIDDHLIQLFRKLISKFVC
jgi:hypothetical protein